MNEPIKVYELKEVASILKINLRVLRRYIKEDKIKASKIGRKYVITAEDLEAFIKGNSNTISLNNEPTEDTLTGTDKALLETMLTKADAGNEVIELNLKEYKELAGNKATEEELEASLNNLLKYEATTEQNLRGVLLTSKASLISSYFKTPTGYEIELSKVLVKLFKENMLINTKIVKKVK